MIKAHIYLDNEFVGPRRLEYCPRVGDTVRMNGRDTLQDNYSKVTEVVWCFNEDSYEGQRVNIRLESEEVTHDR